VRQWFDSSWGGYYSPILEDGCIQLLPRPSRSGIPYSEVRGRCGRRLSSFLPRDYLFVNNRRVWASRAVTTLCPDMGLGAYCEEDGRGPLSRGEAGPGDYIVFLGGLAKYPSGTFDLRRGFASIQEAYTRSQRGVFIIAYMQVVKTVKVAGDQASISSLQLVEPRIEHLLPRIPRGTRVYFDKRPARVLEKPVKVGEPVGRGKMRYSVPPGVRGLRSGRLWLKTRLEDNKARRVIEYLEMLPSREAELWGWRY